MSKKEVLEIVLIAFGIYLVILTITNLFDIIHSVAFYLGSQESEKVKGIVYVLTSISKSFFFGVGSWVCLNTPNKITNRFIKSNKENGVIMIKKESVTQVLFQVAGIIIVYLSVSHLVYGIYFVSIFGEITTESKDLKYYLLVLGPPIVEILFGLILIFIPKLIGRLLSNESIKDKADTELFSS